MTPRIHVCQASVQRTEGRELPYAVIINYQCWGLFRQERDALLFFAEALGLPKQEMLAAMREREVGER